jgi:amidase
MFPEAQERAKYLDDLKAQGKFAGPLHGLPISIKDLFHVKGTHASIGMISFLDEKSTDNSPLVDILLRLGAVIYVKTNIPQTMMVRLPTSFGCINANLPVVDSRLTQ